MVKIVCIGGGTGLPVVLNGLKELPETDGPDSLKITAIVSVSDSGGSSGELRQAFGIPAVGDVRNCLVALCGNNSPMIDICQYRFPGGDGLQGHSLGNLILTALHHLTGGLGQAVETAKQMLQLRGSVLPVTEDRVNLCAEFEDGTSVSSEKDIPEAGRRIKRVWLEPDNAMPSPGVLQAISCADAIVLSPGSLYSSIVSTLLVPGVVPAMRAARALKIYVCNLMTQPGETDGYSAADHLRVLEQYLWPRAVDICVLNSRLLTSCLEQQYLSMGSTPVRYDEEEISRMGTVAISEDLLTEDGSRVRHLPLKLARLLVDLTVGAMRARDFIWGSELSFA